MNAKPLLAALTMAALVSCSDAPTGRSIMPPDCRLETGDVVLRRGCGLTSRAVVMADGGGAYSHVGIVVDSAGHKMIVHAVPGEPDFDGDEDRVKMVSPDDFFNGSRALRGEVRRHRDTLASRRAARVALQVYERGVLFDHRYDDTDTTRMYCTELVVYAFDRAGAPLQGLQRHRLRFPGIDACCVLPSDIVKCNDLVLTKKF